MKKTICVLQAIVILLSMVGMLTGCGAATNAETKQLVGAWVAKVDMAPVFSAGIKEGLGEDADEMIKHFPFQNYIVYDVMMLYSDGTYSRYMDEAHLKAMLANLKADVQRGLRSYYTQLGKDMNVANVESVLDAWIAFCTGKTLEGLVADIFTADLQNSVMESAKETKGRYKAEDGKIYFSEDPNTAPDGKLCDVYQLEGDELTIVECCCEQDEDDKHFNDLVYPVVYTRDPQE